MGLRLTIDSGSDNVFAVVLNLTLTRRESTDLFLSGDSMVSWPEEGLHWLPQSGLERTAMFVSDLAARSEDLRLAYDTRARAERAAALLRIQMEQLGIGMEE
jgi:hypothetical protein